MSEAAFNTISISDKKSTPERVKRLRAGLLLRGYTLASWAKERGVSSEWVYQCVSGRRRGPAAQKLMQELAAAADALTIITGE